MKVRVGPADIYLERGDITEYEVDPRVNNHRRIDAGDPTLIEPLA